MRALALVVFVLPASGCVTESALGNHRAPGKRVLAVYEQPGPECESLGMVTVEADKTYVGDGTGELELGPGIASLRSAAAGRGADTVHVHAPHVARGEDSDSLVLSGVAYRCLGPQVLSSGAPLPEGTFLAVLLWTTSARSGPHPKAAGLVSVQAGTKVLASDEARNGYRRIRTEDGKALGFVEDRALDLARPAGPQGLTRGRATRPRPRAPSRGASRRC